MLKPAILYQEELKRLYYSTCYDDKYRYFHGGNYIDFKSLEVPDVDFNRIDMVSMNKDGEIIGYIGCDIDRLMNIVTELKVMNFGEKNLTFSRDCIEFLDHLFSRFNVSKIRWRVLVGNPAELIYDKLIGIHGGRIAGYYRQDAKTYRNEICDVKVYEILKEEWSATQMADFKERIKNLVKPKKEENEYVKNARKILQGNIKRITLDTDAGSFYWNPEDDEQQEILKQLVEVFIEIKSR